MATKKKATKKRAPARAASLHKQVKSAQLRLPDGTELELPVYRPTLGPDVIDVQQVLKSGYFTYDPGFMSTAACSSDITFIDGGKGELLHRGYAIDELATGCSFMDVAYLLLHGNLPSKTKSEEFADAVRYHTMVSERVALFMRGFDATAHPMAVLICTIGALAAFYHEQSRISDANSRYDDGLRLIAKVPTLAAMSFKYSTGSAFMYPQNHLSFAENILYMLFANPSEEYVIDQKIVRALEKILILHADHEQNASTSTVRLAGSTNANPYACISAGVSSLWGPAHGGANEAVLRMIHEIGSVKNIPAFIKQTRSKSSNKRLMGFGHRVYKNYDPRAKVMRKVCHELLDHLGMRNDETMKIAMKLEKIALEDDYYIKRNLYPNIDFYSGIVLRAIGIPLPMFTAIFAIARTVGWVAHWLELHSDPEFRIGRPRQLYEGRRHRSMPQPQPAKPKGKGKS